MKYYVTHPSIQESAIVDAPTTEKARTTFLDYLERNGKIARSSRQTMRLGVVAEKVKDGSMVDSDLHLTYTYDGGFTGPPDLSMSLPQDSSGVPLDLPSGGITPEEVEEVPMGPPPSPARRGLSSMPIADVAMRGFV